MKFARYLQDTQTPEWKKAYIDYRGLKKQITAIRNAMAQQQLERDLEGSIIDEQNLQESSHKRHKRSTPSDESYSSSRQTAVGEDDSSSRQPSEVARVSSVSRRDHDITARAPTKRAPFQTPLFDATSDPLNLGEKSEKSNELVTDRPGSNSMPPDSFPRSASESQGRKPSHSSPNLFIALPLHQLLAHLPPEEKKFFDLLATEMDKIESFYFTREKMAQEQSTVLLEQLTELMEHKKIIQAAYPKTRTSWYKRLLAKATARNIIEAEKIRKDPHVFAMQDGLSSKENRKDRDGTTVRGETDSEHSVQHNMAQLGKEKLSSNPEEYHHAKKLLKKAVLEHYRELEALHNFRILNITGFRKSLKKFEKVTKIPAQQFITERVEKSGLSTDKTVSRMMVNVQDIYATVFARGDRKTAMRRLHAGALAKNHHFSTFRSGLFVGLALPALVTGLYHSFQQQTRDAIPGWDGLLFIYGVMLIPVLFAMLIGTNLLAWSRFRINYVFIFELDTRTRLDYRQYYETPSILLAGLCYAFWLSFQQIGAPSLSPTIWPLAWLGFSLAVMANPFPVLSKPSRYWFFKHVGKLLVPGVRRVEFTDFWLGDQFCSVIFSLSNIYLFCCVYASGLNSNWRQCGSSSPRWPVAFVFSVLPLTIRAVQSVRRYIDSKLITHLINGGKYASGIVSYLFYYIWRHQGGHGSTFALWCLFNVVYTIYALCWDVFMDWSIFQRHARYRFLRNEVIYSNSISLYYVAIILNVLLRFIWVLYIPQKGPDMMLRTFIVALLEVLRRWQWNFYRLENEHLGNMDQYRVTREVPLPYSFDDSYIKDDSEDEDDNHIPRTSSALELR